MGKTTQPQGDDISVQADRSHQSPREPAQHERGVAAARHTRLGATCARRRLRATCRSARTVCDGRPASRSRRCPHSRQPFVARRRRGTPHSGATRSSRRATTRRGPPRQRGRRMVRRHRTRRVTGRADAPRHPSGLSSLVAVPSTYASRRSVRCPWHMGVRVHPRQAEAARAPSVEEDLRDRFGQYVLDKPVAHQVSSLRSGQERLMRRDFRVGRTGLEPVTDGTPRPRLAVSARAGMPRTILA